MEMTNTITFGTMRKLVSKTAAIQIMLASTGDVEDNWAFIDLVPERYNDMRVIGFDGMNDISVQGYDFLMKGIEFYLDDIGFPEEDETAPVKEDLTEEELSVMRDLIKRLSLQNTRNYEKFAKSFITDLLLELRKERNNGNKY